MFKSQHYFCKVHTLLLGVYVARPWHERMQLQLICNMRASVQACIGMHTVISHHSSIKHGSSQVCDGKFTNFWLRGD
jgi:hypothetical protein